jgi:hypothetical protein
MLLDPRFLVDIDCNLNWHWLRKGTVILKENEPNEKGGGNGGVVA